MRLGQIFAVLLLAGAASVAQAELAPAPLPGDEPGTAVLPAPAAEKPAAAPVRDGRATKQASAPGVRKTAILAKKAARPAPRLRMAKTGRTAVALKVAAGKPAGKTRSRR